MYGWVDWVIIDLSNDVLSVRHQAISLTNTGVFLVGPSATNSNDYFYQNIIIFSWKCTSNCRLQNVCHLQASTWWRHQVEAFSALLAFCAGNSPVPGEFPAQRPVTRSFDAFFDLRLNKRLSKQSWGWWSQTPSSSLWRHRNESFTFCITA